MIDNIKLSISELLELDSFKNSVLLSGQENLHLRINKLNIIVDPDIKSWIRPEEFLLSTSFFFKSMSIEEQIDFIQLLSDKKIACLGIKFSPHLQSLSDQVINFAKKKQFVIFSIDYKESFTNIISNIYETIFDRQMEVINKISDVHDQAMEILIEGGNIYNIIDTVENATGNRVFIIDNYYDRFYYNNDATKNKEFLTSITTFNNNHRDHASSKRELIAVPINNEIFSRYIFPLHVKNEIYGYIVAFMNESNLQNINIQLIESVSTVASLYFYNRLSLEEVEISYRSEFLENLLSEDSRRVDKAINRSIFFNMNKEDEYQMAQFVIDGEYADSQSILKHLHKIKIMMSYFDQPNVLAIINNRINLLYQYDQKFYDKVISKINEKNIINQTHTVVFGRKVSGLNNVIKSYKDCIKMTKNPGIMSSNHIIDYEKLGVNRLLINEGLHDEISDFYEENLKALVDYDEKRGTNLVETLDAYFKCNGNLRKMSEILYTHYNTVLYRVERIENITGKKLDMEDDRFNLQTSLKIYNLMK